MWKKENLANKYIQCFLLTKVRFCNFALSITRIPLNHQAFLIKQKTPIPNFINNIELVFIYFNHLYCSLSYLLNLLLVN
jgi:hypothetical protein